MPLIVVVLSRLWSRILKVVGGIAMLLGTLDPLEGSVVILAGSGMVALGMFLGRKAHPTVLYWIWAFILIAVGVAAMFALSAVGGIGGRSGHSMWWGLLILPYPVGWLMALAAGVAGLVRFFKAKGQPPMAMFRRRPPSRQDAQGFEGRIDVRALVGHIIGAVKATPENRHAATFSANSKPLPRTAPEPVRGTLAVRNKCPILVPGGNNQ